MNPVLWLVLAAAGIYYFVVESKKSPSSAPPANKLTDNSGALTIGPIQGLSSTGVGPGVTATQTVPVSPQQVPSDTEGSITNSDVGVDPTNLWAAGIGVAPTATTFNMSDPGQNPSVPHPSDFISQVNSGIASTDGDTGAAPGTAEGSATVPGATDFTGGLFS